MGNQLLRLLKTMQIQTVLLIKNQRGSLAGLADHAALQQTAPPRLWFWQKGGRQAERQDLALGQRPADMAAACRRAGKGCGKEQLRVFPVLGRFSGLLFQKQAKMQIKQTDFPLLAGMLQQKTDGESAFQGNFA